MKFPLILIRLNIFYITHHRCAAPGILLNSTCRTLACSNQGYVWRSNLVPPIFMIPISSPLAGNVITYLKKEVIIWNIFIHVYVEAIFIVTFFLKIFFHFYFQFLFIAFVIIAFKVFLSQDFGLMLLDGEHRSENPSYFVRNPSSGKTLCKLDILWSYQNHSIILIKNYVIICISGFMLSAVYALSLKQRF